MSSLANQPGLRVHVDCSAAAMRGAMARSKQSRRRRTHGAFWKLAALLIALVALAAVISGCTASGQAREIKPVPSADTALEASKITTPESDRPHGVAFTTPQEPQLAAESSAQATPESRLLAAQSQRDVDLLLGGRLAGPSPEITGADGPAAHAQPPATPREIQWNDSTPLPRPSPAVIAQAAIPVAAASSTAASQPDTAVVDSTTLKPDRLRQLSVDLARELYATGAYSEHPLRELSLIAAMSMIEPQRRLDPDAVPDLTDDERAVLAGLQTFFGDISEPMSSGTAVTEVVAKAAATLRESLTHEPRLALPTATLCTRVGGFGEYTPFERLTFLAGGEQQVIVYLEVENFVSDVNQNNAYVTDLSQQLTIYSDRDGIPVWKEDWQAATDVSHNKRQDFFTVQVITLPKALGVGRYTLKARMRDEKSRAEAETSISFELVADPKMIQDS